MISPCSSSRTAAANCSANNWPPYPPGAGMRRSPQFSGPIASSATTDMARGGHFGGEIVGVSCSLPFTSSPYVEVPTAPAPTNTSVLLMSMSHSTGGRGKSGYVYQIYVGENSSWPDQPVPRPRGTMWRSFCYN